MTTESKIELSFYPDGGLSSAKASGAAADKLPFILHFLTQDKEPAPKPQTGGDFAHGRDYWDSTILYGRASLNSTEPPDTGREAAEDGSAPNSGAMGWADRFNCITSEQLADHMAELRTRLNDWPYSTLHGRWNTTALAPRIEQFVITYLDDNNEVVDVELVEGERAAIVIRAKQNLNDNPNEPYTAVDIRRLGVLVSHIKRRPKAADDDAMDAFAHAFRFHFGAGKGLSKELQKVRGHDATF